MWDISSRRGPCRPQTGRAADAGPLQAQDEPLSLGADVPCVQVQVWDGNFVGSRRLVR